MPATPARIGFVMQDVRRAISETPEVFTRHGTLARRDEYPVETFFDDLDDAQAIADARQNLLSAERRKFAVSAKGLDQALALTTEGPALPQAVYVDELRGIERDVLIAEVGFDFGAQRATFVVWG